MHPLRLQYILCRYNFSTERKSINNLFFQRIYFLKHLFSLMHFCTWNCIASGIDIYKRVKIYICVSISLKEFHHEKKEEMHEHLSFCLNFNYNYCGSNMGSYSKKSFPILRRPTLDERTKIWGTTNRSWFYIMIKSFRLKSRNVDQTQAHTRIYNSRQKWVRCVCMCVCILWLLE